MKTNIKFKKTNKKRKNNNTQNIYKKGGRSLNTCIQNVNVEQYKYPCRFLPLDGPTQNIYSMYHNSQQEKSIGFNTGGKKSIRRKRKQNLKKGGNYLSVNNDTSAYTRLGAPGNSCGPIWEYTN